MNYKHVFKILAAILTEIFHNILLHVYIFFFCITTAKVSSITGIGSLITNQISSQTEIVLEFIS
jgi:hypothetical protein